MSKILNTATAIIVICLAATGVAQAAPTLTKAMPRRSRRMARCRSPKRRSSTIRGHNSASRSQVMRWSSFPRCRAPQDSRMRWGLDKGERSGQVDAYHYRPRTIRPIMPGMCHQVAVSLSLANDAASLPVAYRLYLPNAWAGDDERRRRQTIQWREGTNETLSSRFAPASGEGANV
jgi:hypothetical protein